VFSCKERGPRQKELEDRGSRMTAFDVQRALLVQMDIFGPFHVTATRPLRDAPARGDVHRNALVLVAERDAATIVLLRRQLIIF